MGVPIFNDSVSHLNDFEKKSHRNKREETWNTSHGHNMCTNLKFDYNLLKWTDNEFTKNENFMRKWKRRFGGFWHNKEGMFPTQPYQPGTSGRIHKKLLLIARQMKRTA